MNSTCRKYRACAASGFAFAAATLLLLSATMAANAASFAASTTTYSTTAEFDAGTGLNLTSAGDELRLDDSTVPFGFIWVAVSSKNTIVKINTDTGAVVGEYRSAPQSSGKGDPSRTTVDKNGSVWVGNRNGGSVVHIGLEENGRCVDRNQNGIIDTSTGLNDIRDWPGVDVVGDALDECIINYTQTINSDARHISVTASNDIWVSGQYGRNFQLVDGDTGEILRTENSVGYGGYGGLIDPNGVIWSARPLLRWDTANPLTGPNGENWTGYGHDSYGLCIDSSGNVWNTALNGDAIYKFDPAGNLIGTYSHGTYYAQGCAIDKNDHVWVAGSLYDNKVGHLLNDGTLVGVVTVGSGPTGVSVDGKGKVWATNFNDGTVSRIDPELGPIGGGGETVGEVDLTTVALGGNTYNYSDMTGSTLIGAPDNGTWSIVYDAEVTGDPLALFGTIGWNAEVIGDGALNVTASSSLDGIDFSIPEPVGNGEPLSVPEGRYLKVTVAFTRATTGESPVLEDLTINTVECQIDDQCNDEIECTLNTCDATGVCLIDEEQCPCPGDCGDPVVAGRISAMDAQFILRTAVGLEQCRLCVCDVDGSGAIFSNDALRDLQYAVGLPAEMSCPNPGE